MVVSKSLNLYLGAPAEVQRPVYVSQNDTGWSFVCTIYSGSQVWTIPSGTTATINGSKPDGSAFTYDCTISGNTVTAPCEEQMTVVPGHVACELKFAQGGKVIATANFRMIVEESPTGEYKPSETELAALDNALDEVQTIAAQVRAAYGAPRTAATAADMTDTSLIYVYTGTTSGALTNGHWYYYNGSAWTDGGVYNSTAFETDPTLTISGAAADAAVTGVIRTELKDMCVPETHYITPFGNSGISPSAGTNMSAANRCRTNFFFQISTEVSPITITVPADKKLRVYEYAEANTDSFIGGATPWANGAVTFMPNPAHYYRMVIGYITDANITYGEIGATDVSYITYALTDKTLSEPGKAADAAATGAEIRAAEKIIFGGEDSAPILDGISNLVPGAIDGTGADVANTGNYYSYRTDYTVCREFSTVSASMTLAATPSGTYYMYVVFYDSAKTFISRVGGSRRTTVTASVPDNAEFVRVSLTYVGQDNVSAFTLSALAVLRAGSPTNKWYVFGDSISAGYYSMTASMAQAAGVTLDYNSPVTTEGGEATGSVWDRSLSHNYWGYANKWALNRELVPDAYPGQGYLRTASNNQNGVYVVNNTDVSDAGLITVAWGFNDWHYNQNRGDHTLIDPAVLYPGEGYDTSQITTVNQAIWYCLGTLIRKAPGAQIIVQTPMNGWAYGGDFAGDWGIGLELSKSGTLADIHDDIVYWANYYGLQVLEMTYNNSAVNRRNIKDALIDGSHPSDATHMQLGRYVGVALKYC